MCLLPQIYNLAQKAVVALAGGAPFVHPGFGFLAYRNCSSGFNAIHI
jgi:acetyl/propionyl-CoA carboxylase alpha subunit